MGAGQRIIDPDTGLELEVLTPAPPSWSADSVRGRMLANDPTQGGASADINPFVAAVEAPTIADPTAQAATPLPVSEVTTGGSPAGGLRPSSLLDKVLFTLFGTPDSKLSPEEESEKHAKRNNVAAMSKSAAENPGAQFMGIPSVSGGSSLGEALSFLPQVIKGIGGII